MNAIETLSAYCESKGWSPIGPGLFLEVLDNAKRLEEQSSSRRWWTDVTRVVEVNGILYQYDSAETTGDESPSDKGWEFDPSSICFVKATKKMEPVFSFEASESPCSIKDAEGAEGMTFGLAIEALKMGKKVARAGWNGKGMFIFLIPGSTFKVNRPPLLGIFPEGTEINYRPHIAMKDAQGSISEWTPAAGNDTLAEDWQVIE